MSRLVARTYLPFSVLVASALVVSSSCIKLPPADPSDGKGAKVDAAKGVMLVWDGDKQGGNAKEWANCNLKEACKSTVKPSPGEGINKSVGLEWHAEGKDWKGFGWNWFGFWPENAGVDVTQRKNLSFWVRLRLDDPSKGPDLKDLKVALGSSSKGKDETEQVPLSAYVDGLSDQQWHEVVIPLSDLTKGKGKDFDLSKTWEFRLGEYSMSDRKFTVLVDNIGFDNREITSLISLPEKREPAPLGGDVIALTAKLNLAADGTSVSPYIYGVSHGDAEVEHEMGVALRRQGGNTSSNYDWRTGFESAGADWYFENRKTLPGPHPQENWWVTMHRENKKYGMKSYFTMPTEWVAKDGTSSGFPKSLYANCDEFAPDRPDACNGKLKEKDKEGKPINIKCGAHPSQNGKFVGLEYNVELVKYCIKDAGFGRADQGGIDIIALDNEPMLYAETHRDMICKGWGYDEYWERTKKYAELIRQADPMVKIASPGLWGWTAYIHASADLEYREKNGLGWGDTAKLPDYAKYGFFARDFMRRCADYKKQTGHDLIDIFDFHAYPNTPKLGWDNRAQFSKPSPELQEFRVRDVRKFWDESYRDPDTWMGKEAWSNGNVAYVPLMKRWMKEVGWSAPLAIGEYDYSGPEGGEEISAAVAQAESFAAFARTEVAYAMYWADPRKHSPVYFAFKMYRNPDGKQTAVGDHFIVADVSSYDDVSVYAFKDKKRNVASIILLNKRAKKGEKLAIDLGAPVPAQQAERYEYSAVNPKAIGALPALAVSGQTLNIELSPMSIVRVDVKM
ncbi:MAG TPA: glycoside hydrolase family 44 protein [Polyangiaceae bacterium]|jgi:hypothetical protein